MLKKTFSQNKYLFLILLLGLVLRVLGLRHGFPFIFHPDEPTVVRSALGIRFFPNPGHFDWPHLYIYLNYFLYMFFAKSRTFLEVLKLKPFLNDIFPLIWNDSLIFYFLTRLFGVLLGAFTVIPVYLSGKTLFNKKIGLFSALAFSIIPFHVWHSHYSVIDVPMVFFFAWATYFSIKTLKSSELKNYILAGLFVGFSASTKYHGALSALVLITAFFGKFLIIEKDPRELLRNFYKPLLSGLFSLVGFLIGTPYALLDWATFSRLDGPKGAFWQFTNVGSVPFENQVSQFLSAFVGKFISDWSFVFVLLFVIAFVYASYLILTKKLSSYVALTLSLVFIPALFYLFYISGFEKDRSHYYMISYPFVALGIGWLTFLLEEKVSTKIKSLLVPVLFIVPLVLSSKNTLMFVRTDTRVLLNRWINLRISDPLYSDRYIYYDTKELAQVLPEKAIRYKSLSKVSHPNLLVTECSAESSSFWEPFNLVHYIDAGLRRGPEICIYESALP